MPLCCSKDEHFSCFLIPCQTGLSALINLFLVALSLYSTLMVWKNAHVIFFSTRYRSREEMRLSKYVALYSHDTEMISWSISLNTSLIGIINWCLHIFNHFCKKLLREVNYFCKKLLREVSYLWTTEATFLFYKSGIVLPWLIESYTSFDIESSYNIWSILYW